MPQAVKWKGRQVTIDVLEVRRQIQAGTLSPADRRIVDQILPGVIDTIPIPGIPENGKLKPAPKPASDAERRERPTD